MEGDRRTSLTTDIREQQARMAEILSRLDNGISGPSASSFMRYEVDDLLMQLSGNQTDLQGDLSSILESFKTGMMSPDQLESMIQNERMRSNYIINESAAMQKKLEMLVKSFNSVLAKIDMNDDEETSTHIEVLQAGMEEVVSSIVNFSKVAKSPARQVADIVTDCTVVNEKRRQAVEELEASISRISSMASMSSLAVPSSPLIRDSKSAGNKDKLDRGTRDTLSSVVEISQKTNAAPIKVVTKEASCQTTVDLLTDLLQPRKFSLSRSPSFDKVAALSKKMGGSTTSSFIIPPTIEGGKSDHSEPPPAAPEPAPEPAPAPEPEPLADDSAAGGGAVEAPKKLERQKTRKFDNTGPRKKTPPTSLAKLAKAPSAKFDRSALQKKLTDFSSALQEADDNFPMPGAEPQKKSGKPRAKRPSADSDPSASGSASGAPSAQQSTKRVSSPGSSSTFEGVDISQTDDKLLEQVNVANLQIEKLEGDLVKLQKQLNDTEKDMETAITESKLEKDKLLDTIDDLKHKISVDDQHTKRIKELEHELAHSREEATHLHDAVRKLENEISKLKNAKRRPFLALTELIVALDIQEKPKKIEKQQSRMLDYRKQSTMSTATNITDAMSQKPDLTARTNRDGRKHTIVVAKRSVMCQTKESYEDIKAAALANLHAFLDGRSPAKPEPLNTGDLLVKGEALGYGSAGLGAIFDARERAAAMLRVHQHFAAEQSGVQGGGHTLPGNFRDHLIPEEMLKQLASLGVNHSRPLSTAFDIASPGTAPSPPHGHGQLGTHSHPHARPHTPATYVPTFEIQRVVTEDGTGVMIEIIPSVKIEGAGTDVHGGGGGANDSGHSKHGAHIHRQKSAMEVSILGSQAVRALGEAATRSGGMSVEIVLESACAAAAAVKTVEGYEAVWFLAEKGIDAEAVPSEIVTAHLDAAIRSLNAAASKPGVSFDKNARPDSRLNKLKRAQTIANADSNSSHPADSTTLGQSIDAIHALVDAACDASAYYPVTISSLAAVAAVNCHSSTGDMAISALAQMAAAPGIAPSGAVELAVLTAVRAIEGHSKQHVGMDRSESTPAPDITEGLKNHSDHATKEMLAGGVQSFLGSNWDRFYAKIHQARVNSGIGANRDALNTPLIPRLHRHCTKQLRLIPLEIDTKILTGPKTSPWGSPKSSMHKESSQTLSSAMKGQKGAPENLLYIQAPSIFHQTATTGTGIQGESIDNMDDDSTIHSLEIDARPLHKRKPPPRDVKAMLKDVENPLLVLYEEYAHLLPDLARARLFRAVNNSSGDSKTGAQSQELVNKLFAMYIENVLQIQKACKKASREVGICEKMAKNLAVLTDAEGIPAVVYNQSLQTMLTKFGELEVFQAWAGLQLVELRAVMDEVKAKKLDLSASKVLQNSHEFGMSLNALTETQGKLVDLKRRLSLLKKRCARFNFSPAQNSFPGIGTAGELEPPIDNETNTNANTDGEADRHRRLTALPEDMSVPSVGSLIDRLRLYPPIQDSIETIGNDAVTGGTGTGSQSPSGGASLTVALPQVAVAALESEEGTPRIAKSAEQAVNEAQKSEHAVPFDLSAPGTAAPPPQASGKVDADVILGGNSEVYDDATVTSSIASVGGGGGQQRPMSMNDELPYDGMDHGQSGIMFMNAVQQEEIRRLKKRLRDVEDDVEQLQLEKFKITLEKDCTPGALMFFAAFHDPHYLTTVQQLVLQLKNLKGFAEGKAHLDFITLRKRLLVCVSACLNLENFVTRYIAMHKRWVLNRFELYSTQKSELPSGLNNSAAMCPLCCGDISHTKAAAAGHALLVDLDAPSTDGSPKVGFYRGGGAGVGTGLDNIITNSVFGVKRLDPISPKYASLPSGKKSGRPLKPLPGAEDSHALQSSYGELTAPGTPHLAVTMKSPSSRGRESVKSTKSNFNDSERANE